MTTPAPATVRYWAAARAAAGLAEEHTDLRTIGELRGELSRRPELTAVIGVASFLIDGVRGDDDATITPGAIVDVLPPFAGG